MLDAARNDDKLAFFNPNLPIWELNQQAAFDHQEQFIFRFVMMPHELALELYQFYNESFSSPTIFGLQ